MDDTRTVSAFRGLTYSMDRYGGHSAPERIRVGEETSDHPGCVADLTDVACPPYDVIDEAEREALLARNDRNAIRLELSAGSDPYREAAETLDTWRADGTLTRPDEPRVYYYAHARRDEPGELLVTGVLLRVLLEPWGGRVRPHERTMPGPKRDRLALLEAARTQFSPILALYFDRSERYRYVMSRSWSDEWRARDRDGILHQVAEVEPDERLLGYLGRQQLYIADGHHRYETALAYQQDVRESTDAQDLPAGALAADWVMAVLVNAELEELEILPTHRTLRGLDPELVRRLPEQAAASWDIESVAADDVPRLVVAMTGGDRAAVGAVVHGVGGFVLRARADAVDARMRRERGSTAVRRLDLTVLHATLFADVLGIDVAAEGGAERISYTKDAREAVASAVSGEAQVAFILRPTRIEDVAAVARAGDVMPQKSTYFYPKLLTGMVFNPLED